MEALNSGGEPAGRGGILHRLFGGEAEPCPPVRGAARREGPAIAIASGKGGTGKSFLATSLAIALNDAGRRATLVDCDFGLACDHLLLGVTPKHTLQHVVDGRANGHDVRVVTRFGPTLVPGGSGIRKMASLDRHELERLADALGAWASDADVMLLDLGAGLSPQSILTLLAVDHVVLVSQPEIAALTDAYAVVKCLSQRPPTPRFSVVINRVAVPGQGVPTFEKLARVAERFTRVRLHYLGEIGEEPAVTQRRLGQPPILVSHPQCATALEIRSVLNRLAAVAGPLCRRTVQPAAGVGERFRKHVDGLS